MGGQLPGVGGVVAGHMGDDGQLALGLGHQVLENQLALGDGLVDALAGICIQILFCIELYRSPDRRYGFRSA